RFSRDWSSDVCSSDLEQLAGGRLTSEEVALLERLVLSESDRLSRLLSEFIEFSRVELRGRERVDLLQVVRGAVRLVEQHPDAAEDRKRVVEGEGGGRG